MKKIIFSVIAIAFIASSGYCQEAQVSIKTDKSEYTVGEELTVTITNNSAKPIQHYGICSITICEHGKRGWFCSEKDCHSPKKTILPGGSLTFINKVNAPYVRNTEGALGTRSVATQRYRFEYYEEEAKGIKTIYSNEFIVKPK